MAKQTATQTDFDDDAEIEEKTRPDTQVTTPKDDDGVPYCAKHHCRMRQVSGGKAGSGVAYHKCPVDGCEETAKRIKATKPAAVIPSEALLCARCSGLTPRPIMERDAKVSSLMYTILKCPVCGHKSQPMPRPEFVANHARARGVVSVPDLGSR